MKLYKASIINIIVQLS